MADLKSVPLFELVVEFPDADARQIIGDGGRGRRVVAPAASGAFEGEHLRGEVVSPWPDGVIDHEIRVVLKTDDQALIYMQYEGIGHSRDLGPLGGAEGTLYFRTFARFETGAERYEWLNRIIAAMVSHRVSDGLGWSVHAIL